ncbi:MAG TPA: DUF4426 domain-containing protein [Rhodanobacteraceae bacterium]|nr:DUF4426 domain-containing protein [Rhodanobacteraceae bacterium]
MRHTQVRNSTNADRRAGAIAWLYIAAFALVGTAAHAQYAENFGEYRVRYNALPTQHLLPSVAQAYGIVRSHERGLVNIAVQRNSAGDTSAPIRATLSGTATSLGGQRVALKFREIAEDGAVYYIAEFPISAPDTYRFDVSITPESATSPYLLKFGQDFVAD